MIGSVLFPLWFFLPAGVANMAPVFAAKIPVLSSLDTPLDGGLKLNGKRIFGDHKTVRGLISGILLAILFVWLQQVLYTAQPSWFGWSELDYRFVNPLIVGFLLGFGALGGDALKSFFKRQLGVKPGDSWFPFDQIDYILGAIIITAGIITLPFVFYLFSILLWICLHLVVSYIGFLLKLKEKPM